MINLEKQLINYAFNDSLFVDFEIILFQIIMIFLFLIIDLKVNYVKHMFIFWKI